MAPAQRDRVQQTSSACLRTSDREVTMAIPLLVAGGIAAAGALAKGAAAAAGAGKNRRQPGAFYDPDGKRGTGYDANASNWGGQPGGRQQYEQNLHNSQMGVEGRQGPQVNYQQADWDRMQSGLARNGQNLAAHAMLNRGLGNTPTIAGQQAAIDTQKAVAGANAQTASARTAGGIALAQQNAANTQANAISSISGQAQVNAAQEQVANLNAASGAYGSMRSGDFQAQQNAAQQAQTQAQLDANARAQNDQRAMQYEQLKFGANAAELNSKMQNQGILAGSYNNKESLGQQTAQANANREGQQVDSIINGVTNTAGMAAGGAKAEGGPVAAKKPYVVGEQGPEIIVPKQPGVVIPNKQTKMVLNKGGTKYDTKLEADDEQNFQQWFSKVAHKGETGADYDYRGAYKAGISADPKTAHWPDTFKKPNHETFSNESQYATGEDAQKAGYWDGEKYIKAGDARFREDVEAIKHGSWTKPGSDVQTQAMLDDRERQLGPGAADDVMSQQQFQQGIEQSIVADRAKNTQASRDAAMTNPNQTIQDDAARQQWERINGPIEGAENDARTSDNLKEMQKTNARLGTGGSKKPWYMTDVSGISMTGNSQPKSMDGRSVWEGGNTFQSDDRTKLAAAWDAGRKSAGDDLQRYQGMSPEQLQEVAKKDRLAESLRTARRDTWDAALMTAQDTVDAEEAPPEPEFVAPPIATTLPPKAEKRPATMGRNFATPARQRPMGSDERTKSVDHGLLAGANRAMKGEPYTYKNDHVPMHEKPGQPHYGFMAQNLEKNPISATAVEEGPGGFKEVDRDRMLQVVASGLADLQRQQDELRTGLRKGGRKKAA
jgi:hypothetical protein